MKLAIYMQMRAHCKKYILAKITITTSQQPFKNMICEKYA